MGAHILNSENFDSFIKEGKVVIDFFATWCGPCKMMAPVMDKLSSSIKEVKFGAVDIDKDGALAQKFQVRGVPTFLFFEDGSKVGVHVGGLSYEEFEKKIKEIF